MYKTTEVRMKFWLPALLGAAVMLTGWYAVHLSSELSGHERHRQISRVLSTQAAEIERRLSHTLTATYILAQEILRAEGRFDAFDEFAESVLQMIPGISNLQIAPGGVIEQIYPLAGNERAIGHHILVDDARREEAQLAIERRGLTLAGPFELIQGGVAVIGRNPVFLRKDGVESFWGFTSALIHLEDLLGNIGLQSLNATNTNYQLGRIHPGSGELEVFAGNTNADFKATHSVDIIVPNGKWILSAQHAGKEISSSAWMGYVLTLIASLLASALSYRFVREPSRLRSLVAEKTADLHHMAYHDALTGLPNRRGFMELLKHYIDEARTDNRPLTLMLIDLDFFKEINDTLGHQMGDTLLQKVATRLQACTYQQLALSRWGGDEFIAVLPNDLNHEECHRVAACIRHRLSEPVMLAGSPVVVSASIGMAALDAETLDAECLLKYADLAMYETKKVQRGSYTLYSIDLQLREQRRQNLKRLLQDAIVNKELQLFYQPIVCARSGDRNKAEALLRWFSPQLGVVNPDEIIPLAEETGLINEIGDWIFDQAMSQVAKWRKQYSSDFQISINVSPTQFRSERIAQRWITRLASSGLDTSCILLEITETVMLDNSEQTRRQINKLTDAGFQLALDDFGTGYSSLSYLKTLDLDYIKIDRAFVKNLPDSSHDLVLCKAIITIARQMGLQVVAEGVETNAQRAMLKSMGASYLQGYLFSQPLQLKEFESLLTQSVHDIYQEEAVAC